MGKISVKRYKLSCFFTLVLMAACLGGAHFVETQIIATGQRAALAVDTARRQSHLVADLPRMTEFHNPASPAQRQALQTAITRMGENHAALTQGAAAPRMGDPLRDYIAAQYTRQPGGISASLREFLNDATQFMETPDDVERNRLAGQIRARAEDGLATQTENIVRDYAQNGVEHAQNLSRLGMAARGAALLVLLLQFFTLSLPAARRVAELEQSVDSMASTDQLTGAYNRRMLLRISGILMSTARRQKNPIGMLAVEINDFKALKDKYGHSAGEGIVKAVAGCIMQNLRHSDVLGRVGGEDFAVVLPNTNDDAAVYVAEKLRAAVAGEAFTMKGEAVPLRISLGIAMADHTERTPEDLLRKADAALVEARNSAAPPSPAQTREG